MTDCPILFSSPMVRALLNGRKTQTRRVFKPRGFEFYTHPVSGDRFNQYRPYRDGSWDESRISSSGSMEPFGWGEHLYAYLPFAPGDRLWVRETLRASSNDQGSRWYGYAVDGTDVWPLAEWTKARDNIVSIHMPRWASRLTLLVTDVRVQRLQEISEEDAVAEGCFKGKATGRVFESVTAMRLGGAEWSSARYWFADLWDSLNAERGHAWDTNPWVVAVTFTVHHGNIDAMQAAGEASTEARASSPVPSGAKPRSGDSARTQA